ncbi:MAG: ABC transporter ATP-binding protein [Acidobacteriota bacterium]
MQVLRAKLAAALAQLPHFPRALKLAWEAAPGWTSAWAALLLVQGLLPAAVVHLTRAVVDSITAAVRGGGAWESVRPALLLVGAMAAILLLAEVLRSAAGLVRTAQADLVQDHINGLIHSKSASVDLAFYDSPDYYDHLHRARAEASHRPVALLESLGNLLQNTITLAAMLAVLVPFGLWLPLALVASTLPAFFVVIRYAVRQHLWRLRTTEDERRTWYYDWLLTDGESAAELRLFGLGGHFRSAFQHLRKRLRGERLQLAKEETLAELAAGLCALAVTGGALAWMVWKAARGLVTLGELAMFYQAFQQGLRLMRSLLDNVAELYANSLFLGNLFLFLELQNRITEPAGRGAAPAVPEQAIRFVDVTFRYPASDRVALSHFNLAVPAGSIAAIVGPNGAGKSTLVKLLCRFYDPDSGRVELDGVDLREIPVEELRRKMGVLFQVPVHYSATAAENIALGDLAAGPGAAELTAAARDAGAEEVIARLPQGQETLLGRWFQAGTELSVGEWQRLALARALLRRGPVLILDEPTSAMDPWAEAEWLDRLRLLAAGRTVILITHRLTTAMRADVIHVMSDGEIVESGAHDHLSRRDGLYAQLWTRQMSCL